MRADSWKGEANLEVGRVHPVLDTRAFSWNTCDASDVCTTKSGNTFVILITTRGSQARQENLTEINPEGFGSEERDRVTG